MALYSIGETEAKVNHVNKNRKISHITLLKTFFQIPSLIEASQALTVDCWLSSNPKISAYYLIVRNFKLFNIMKKTVEMKVCSHSSFVIYWYFQLEEATFFKIISIFKKTLVLSQFFSNLYKNLYMC